MLTLVGLCYASSDSKPPNFKPGTPVSVYGPAVNLPGNHSFAGKIIGVGENDTYTVQLDVTSVRHRDHGAPEKRNKVQARQHELNAILLKDGDPSENLWVTFDRDIKQSMASMSRMYPDAEYDSRKFSQHKQLLDSMSGGGWVKLNRFPKKLGGTLEREFNEHNWVGSYWKTIRPGTEYVMLTYVADAGRGEPEWHFDYAKKQSNDKWNIRVLYRISARRCPYGIDPNDPACPTWWVAIPEYIPTNNRQGNLTGTRQFDYSDNTQGLHWKVHYLRLKVTKPKVRRRLYQELPSQ